MHRIDGPGNDGGMFTEGNATLGIPRTIVTDDWANAVQEEIVQSILATGLALNKPDNTQLLQAIRLLIRGDRSAAPIGAVVAVSGTFSAANNGGVYNEAGVTIGAAWKLCDGSQIVDAESPFNGRYVPKLDDGRFLRGSASAGGAGGQAALNPSVAFAAVGNYTPGGSVGSHSHNMSGHTHGGTTGIPQGSGGLLTDTPGGGAPFYDSHVHAFTSGGPSTADTSAASPMFSGTAAARSDWFLNSNVSIEPVYLATRFYQRIK
jgi:hypothetical protein